MPSKLIHKNNMDMNSSREKEPGINGNAITVRAV